MKIHLIHPSLEKSDIYSGKEGPKIASLTLPTVAAVTPSDVEVTIQDERVEKLNFDISADLVGITSVSRLASRAYQIALEFKKKNIPVILGGIHPTALPEEAIQYANSVVIGEAENTWPMLVNDFKKGKLKKFYRSEKLPSLKSLPLPRRDLLEKKNYETLNTVQATRGCPYNCNFCFTPKFFKKSFRFRPVNDVINEIKTLKGREVIFLDDNIVGNFNYAKELFMALVECNKWWFSQASIDIGEDEDLLKLTAKSGCKVLLIGFESLTFKNLKEANKGWSSVKQYKNAIGRIHDYGISIIASFVVGFDHDDASCFENILAFLIDNKIDFMQCNPLSYFPGTDLYLKSQQNASLKLGDEKWWAKGFPYLYKSFHKPKLISIEDLENGCLWLMKEFYSYESILKRLMRTPLSLLLHFLLINNGFRKLCLDSPLKGYNPNERHKNKE